MDKLGSSFPHFLVHLIIPILLHLMFHEVTMVSMVMKINTHLREREDLNKFSATEHVQKPTAPP